MLRVEPPLALELPPPQPASSVAAIKKNAAPAYAYCLRLAASIIESINAIIASAVASHASKTNGVPGGRISMMPGGNAEIAVFSVAVQDAFALVATLNPVGVQVAAVPRLAPPLRNCTVPVGPVAELLFVLTVAVSVTLPPDATLVTLEVTAVVVVACVIVIVFVAEVLPVKLLSPAYAATILWLPGGN